MAVRTEAASGVSREARTARPMMFASGPARLLGVSVSELLAELATFDSERVRADSNDIAELDRRWKKIDDGTPTVRHEHVVRWLRTWGTPAFRSWRAH